MKDSQVTFLHRIFNCIVVAMSVLQLLVYFYTGLQIYKRPQRFLWTLWTLFTLMSVCLLVYFLLFSLLPHNDVQVSLWYIGSNCYSVGHFLFSY